MEKLLSKVEIIAWSGKVKIEGAKCGPGLF